MTRALRQRLRAAAADESGFSLIELLVAAMVGIVVLGAAFQLLEVGMRSTERVQTRVDVVQRGRIAMENITRQLRSQVCLNTNTPAIVQGDASSVTFYSDIGDESWRPELRRIRMSGNAIIEEVDTQSPPDNVLTVSRTRTLVDRVALNGTTPLFRYYAFATTDPITPSILLPTPLSAADAARTVQVNVSFVAQPLRGNANDKTRTVFENQVFVRNSDPGDPERSPQCL